MSPVSNSLTGRQVIIIGAGIHGLAAAKTYLEIKPDIQLTIIDNDDSVGGVWSRSRAHSNLIADSPTPTFDFSDIQMGEEFNLPAWSTISGPLMYEYLERYAKKFDILRRCVFNTDVTSVERNGNGWLVHTTRVDDDDKVKTYTCDVLMVATGNFSVPKLPNIDTSSFEGKIFHTKDLSKCSAELSSKDIETVAVVGGNKSSFEAVSMSHKAGKNVHWLIREDGAGAGVLTQASLPNGMPTSKFGYIRIFGLVLPTIYRQTRTRWDRFFLSGKNALGRKLFDRFWENATLKRIGDRYNKSENGKLLRPHIQSLFWSPAGTSLVHNQDLGVIDAIDQGERIHVARTSIISMKGRSLQLSNQPPIEVDAVIFATGWESPINRVFTSELKAELGLPVPWDSLPTSEAKYWRNLDALGDRKVLDLYPIFQNPPHKYIERDAESTPFRLFRGLVPPTLATNNRNVVFLGKLANVQQTTLAEINALWSVTYLEGLLPLEKLVKDEDAMKQEVALVNAFMRRRYPGRKNIPIALLEVRDWMDAMLRDLGLRTDRNRLAWERSADKGFGWWGLKGWTREWFKPYEPIVYKGIVGEYLELLNKQDNGKKTT